MTNQNEIQIESARNQKTEHVPMFETYYVGYARQKNERWFCVGGAPDGRNKQELIDNIRTYWSTYHEVKIISLELPFSSSKTEIEAKTFGKGTRLCETHKVVEAVCKCNQEEVE